MGLSSGCYGAAPACCAPLHVGSRSLSYPSGRLFGSLPLLSDRTNLSWGRKRSISCLIVSLLLDNWSSTQVHSGRQTCFPLAGAKSNSKFVSSTAYVQQAACHQRNGVRSDLRHLPKQILSG